MTTEQTFPSVKIEATGRTALRVELPGDAETWYPVVPDELIGKDLPSFVAEWIIEADEIGVIIQELLQAPTRSLCRIMPISASRNFTQGTWGKIEPTRPYLGGFSVGGLDVRGFSGEAETIEGQPEGVMLPRELEETIAMAKRLDAWLEKGRRVRAWLDEEGYGDLSWIPQTASAG